MSVHGDHLFGGRGSATDEIAKACSGCFVFDVVLPDCDFAAVDPLGDARRLQLIGGGNIFLPTFSVGSRSSPFVNNVGAPDERIKLGNVQLVPLQGNGNQPFYNPLVLVSHTQYIDTAQEKLTTNSAQYGECMYIVGAEAAFDSPMPTPAVLISMPLYVAALPPAPRPYLFISASKLPAGPQVRLSLGAEAKSTAEWSVYSTVAEFDPSQGRMLISPLVGAGLFNVVFDLFYDDTIQLPAAQELGDLPDSQPITFRKAMAGIDLAKGLVSRSAVATPPTDWGKIGTAAVDGNPIGHGISVGKEVAHLPSNAAGADYRYFRERYLAATADVSGAVAQTISWAVPVGADIVPSSSISASQAALPPNGGYGNAAPELFCSPWSGRGTARAFGTTVTFGHNLETNDDTGADAFFVGFGLSLPPELEPPFNGKTYTPSPSGSANVAIGNYGEAIFPIYSRLDGPFRPVAWTLGGFHIQVRPRMLESTAPPHLPSRPEDVIDVEQCIFYVDQNFVTANTFRHWYVGAPCLTQDLFDTAADEERVPSVSGVPAFYDRQYALSPYDGTFSRRLHNVYLQSTESRACVVFSGAHRHFTLPTNDSQDMTDLTISIATANDGLAAKSVNAPLARSRLFSTNPQIYNELVEFSPSSYVSAKSICGQFGLAATRADGKWLGQNAFCYAGPGSLQQYQIKASATEFPAPAALNTASSDGAATFTSSITPADFSPCTFEDQNTETCFRKMRIARQAVFQKINYGNINVGQWNEAGPYRNGFVDDFESYIDPDLAQVVFGTDWTFRQNYAAIRCTVGGSPTVPVPNLIAHGRPNPVFNVSVVAIGEAWCHKVYFDKREWKRDQLPFVTTGFGGSPITIRPPAYAGERISSDSVDVDLARSTFTVTHSFSLSCNSEEAEEFYARRPVTLYARIGKEETVQSGRQGYYQQLRGNEINLYPAIAVTFQAG